VSPTFIAGSGYHHPEARLTNADLEAMVDTSDEWIMRHTGIRERRRAAEDVDTSDLAVIATQRALDSAGLAGADLDAVICATSTPDFLVPATASFVANKMGLRAVAFDLNASCSGFVYGLAVADSLMEAHGFGRVALVAAEKYTRVTDYEDRRTAIFWGDGAGAVVLSRERPAAGAEVVDVSLTGHNEGAELAVTPVGGFFTMNGPAIRPIATDLLVRSAREMLDRHGLGVSDLRAFMSHQMNMRLLEALVAELGVTDEQHWHNVELAGNQGGAGVATTLCAGLERGDVRDGDHLLLTVVGTGFTAGSALLRGVGAAGGRS
jgi:3-oxoacyl-[acyl-carrier-protein] synthase-3